MVIDNLTQILTEDEVLIGTMYSVSQIWDKRPWLSGNTDYQIAPDNYAQVKTLKKRVGEVILNTGIDSPAVEIKPQVTHVEQVRLAHAYFTHSTSVHEYNQLVRQYQYVLNNKANGVNQEALDVIKKWSLSSYNSVVDIYVQSSENGLCQALTNPKGWVIPAIENQEPKTYYPGITHTNNSATLSDFGTMDPMLKFLNDLVLPANTEGYKPNVILVGDDIAQAIINSPFYASKYRTAPIPNIFAYTPKESSSMVQADGVIELLGINVGGLRVFWINSKLVTKSGAKPNFETNCAVALDIDNFASMYSGPMFVNKGLRNDVDFELIQEIIRFAPQPIINEKQITYNCEYNYLPVINDPLSIFRIYYS